MWRPFVTKRRSETTVPTFTNDTLTSETSTKPFLPRRPTIPSRSTLSEALRSNPFRPSSRDACRTSENTPEDPIRLLNADLHILATIYPDVQLDVLRELLLRFDGSSRIQVCVEQLFRYKAEWARGRILNPPRDLDDKLPRDELFRSTEYSDTCRQTLYIEFKSLNRSAIDAVLAEVNNSYAKARPVLQEVAAKSWRAALTSFFRKKKDSQEPPSFLVATSRDGLRRLVPTYNLELDQELDLLFFATVRNEAVVQQRDADFRLASDLNAKYAEEVGALFECQCCFDDVPFEQIINCTVEGHVFCIACIQRTLNEALFGQTWNKSVDMSMCTLRCFAPSSGEDCTGHISYQHLRRIIRDDKKGKEVWSKFEQRLATDNLAKSRMSLQSCPFCPYAEVIEPHSLQSAAAIRWRIRVEGLPIGTFLLIVLFFFKFLLPALLFVSAYPSLILPYSPQQLFRQSLVKIGMKSRTHKFICRSPSCRKKSCTLCHKQWHDPHVCHEPLVVSLRSAVEAARTAALKRVCPRCGTCFVKDSGCNKLVCVCGYAMCYLCRKNIGKVSTSAEGEAGGGAGGVFNFNFGPLAGPQPPQPQEHPGDREIIAMGEGYRHFCPHFRPIPGTKCSQCDKCDLYKTEDEEAVVRRAGELAESQWRSAHESEAKQRGEKVNEKILQNALVGINDGYLGSYPGVLSKRVIKKVMKRIKNDIRRGTWREWRFDWSTSVQTCVDWLVERTIIVINDGS